MKNSTKKTYEEILKASYKTHLLNSISGLISWDQETMMPPAAAAIRGEQLEILSGVIHESKISPEFVDPLSKLIDLKSGKILAEDLTSAEIAALKNWRRDYLLEVALPKNFVEEFAKLSSESIVAWSEAKKENNFSKFAPFLERLVVMNRQKAEYFGYKEHPYDALLESFEPGMCSSKITTLFAELKDFLIPFIKKIASQPKIEDHFLKGRFSAQKQLKFSHKLLKSIGYEMAKGRLDISNHPFSSAAHPTDSRITTKTDSNHLFSNISATLHEAGHALYEMGLPIEKYGSPLGEALSLGIHESQSRFFETRIGLSLPFWSYFLPILQKNFKGKLEAVSLEEFYKGINKVEPSLIRIEADEVTYNLHIILRYEIEKALIEGTLKVKDLPKAWNQKMEELFGICPKNDAEGCLQDIHWSMGAFGYFPTYALGNIYASHLFLGFEKDNPDYAKKLSSGDFLFIKEWLFKNVYQYGRELSQEELLLKATGKKPSAEAFIHYLQNKYGTFTQK